MNFESDFLERVMQVYYLYKYKNRRIRTMYIRPIFKRRNVQSEASLVDELGSPQEERYHHKYFRMDKDQFHIIQDKIFGFVYHSPSHLRPISLRDRLAITLRFLATGMKQLYLAMSYRISPSSVTKILREIMTAICDAFEGEYLPEPNAQEWLRISREFTEKWNFPNACGSLDGKHIRIKCPPKSGSVYYNYKSYYSIVLMAVADASYKFTLVDIGGCGAVSDGGIFKNSNIGKKLDANGFDFPPTIQVSPEFRAPSVFLADDAFPLRPNLMKPFPGQTNLGLRLDQRIYNYRHSRARMVVENTFGIFQARFRIFETPIDGHLDFIKLTVKTCVILHNLLCKKQAFFGLTVDSEMEGEMIAGNWREIISNDTGIGQIIQQGSNNATQTAFKIRESFQKYFSSSAGELEWQVRSARRGYE